MSIQLKRLTERAKRLMQQAEKLGQRTSKLCLQTEQLLRGLGRERPVARQMNPPPDVVQAVSCGKVQSLKMQSLRCEVRGLREEMAQHRARSRRQVAAIERLSGFNPTLIDCEEPDWEDALHSCLFKGAEAHLLNFDPCQHAESCEILAEKFVGEFWMVHDWQTRTVRFRRCSRNGR